MTDRPLRFEPRMSGAEALMWSLERDPTMSSSFMNVTILDRPADVADFRRRMERAVVLIPRLRQRVVESAAPWAAPGWEDDPAFDLEYHVRRLALPAPGTMRTLLDLAAQQYSDVFDVNRPLWRFTLVDGLEGGQGALLAKMHHTISDGVGAIRLSAMFTDLERDAPPVEVPDIPLERVAAPPEPSLGDLVGTLGRWAFDQAAQRVRRPQDLPREAIDTVETARSVSRQLFVTESSHSTLWAGRQSRRRHFEMLSTGLDAAKAAAKAAGATLNDFYVAALAGGAGAYHRARGAEVPELRITMPISTRTDRSAGGNAFTPTRVLVPTLADPAARMAAVHERLSSVKGERALGMTDAIAVAARGLPSALVMRLARQQVGTVDFAASNVRGAPFDLFIGGAMVLANHPMGPTGGTAFNATLMSYRGNLDIGLNIDPEAVDDPRQLRDFIAAAITEQTTP
ncbi:MAG TPA: wax ester/triacylglycerol synthase domain-containing protein [Acidimicrobiales bacterium]|nr:wax ester/triacylglycerol synthase domain-containing protein [Acidimicrobiales bacterium]